MMTADCVSVVEELPSAYVKGDGEGEGGSAVAPSAVRVFQLHVIGSSSNDGDDDDNDNDDNCNNVTVELCSLGASITKILLPSSTSNSSSSSNTRQFDDVVLGYESPLFMYAAQNPSYMGTVVGRVANRIANGQFTINNYGNNHQYQYQLDTNNPPNHLHGGYQGFSKRIWDASIVNIISDNNETEHEFVVADNNNDVKENGNGSSKQQQNQGVQFTYLSSNGDQKYPGTVRVTATYWLQHGTKDDAGDATGGGHGKFKLRMQLHGELLDDIPTPINMSQHSYFNLAGHNDPNGILDHTLSINNSNSYTPVDCTGIPTKSIVDLINDPTMDFQQQKPNRRKLLANALVEFGIDKGKLSKDDALRNIELRRKSQQHVSAYGPDGTPAGVAGTPYGFDHNYCINNNNNNKANNDDDDDDDDSSTSLPLVAILEYPKLQRKMTIRATAPGVQCYTGNYLDGSGGDVYKDSAVYGQWQGLCLETQHYPDSISVNQEKYPEFAKGQCIILSPEQRHYTHNISYEFEYKKNRSQELVQQQQLGEGEEYNPQLLESFRGRDSEGTRQYSSVKEMWESQGVYTGGGENKAASAADPDPTSTSTRNNWYNRAEQYYEDNCSATVNGVLGGFASISDLDLEFSNEFTQELANIDPEFKWSSGAACECGAGIGRVTKGLLLSLGVSRCDLVESSSRLISAAPEYIGDDNANSCRFYCTGLQDWKPKPRTYSIIWIQWVFCYLTDDDAVDLLRRCGEGLVPGGFICLKENTCGKGTGAVGGDDFVVDIDDASVTRSVRYLKHLAYKADLSLVLERMQTNFPDEIFPVPLLAFQPKQT